MLNILLQKQRGANAVVTIAHTGARDIARYTREADIVIAAIGRPGFITGSMLKPGCVVIDVGINRIPDLSEEIGHPDRRGRGFQLGRRRSPPPSPRFPAGSGR